MAKSNRKITTYPEEKEGKVRDANKKLKSQVRSLKKTIKQLESQVHTLSRSFDKSCDFIQHKLEDKKLEDILNMIDNFGYKETSRGRAKKKKIDKKPTKQKCPSCEATEGFKVIEFKSRGFAIESCTCGYSSRVNIADEGSKGS